MSGIRVLVASDSALLREGIQTLLSPCSEVEIVGKTEAGDEVIEEARRLRPQILILDIPEPSSARLELLARLKTELPELGVITVSYQQDEAPILSVLQTGVQGYLCGQEGAAELIAAVQAVAEGDSYLCPAASGVLVRHYRRKRRSDRLG
ncbi:MAG: response regulator transcription factor [Anaerolineae bacterium]